ncbi:MAG: carbohydrate ABC transporter permease [Chloroflexi bacterium]|nr:carbohydrate ABC transporter permease [Chloroflexota bacterium]
MAQTRTAAIGTHEISLECTRSTLRLGRVLLYLAVILLAAGFFAPFFWTITTSLKSPDEVFVFPPQVFPKQIRFSNYPEVFARVPFGLFYRNTILVTILATLGTVLSTTLVAFGFARRRFPLRNQLFFLLLSTMMLPGEVTLIPQFLLFKSFGWLDTLYPLIVPSYLGIGAFNIFLMRQFFMTIPMDFDEAAMLDGASSLRILFVVLLPLIQPALITISILSFLGHWNDFFTPLIYLNTTEKMTLSVGLRWFQTSFAYSGGDVGEPKEQLLMAASLMTALPCVILFFVAQRYFVQGVVMSGIKA